MVDKSKVFLIVGLGLMGGSYAKSLKLQGYHVMSIARRQETIDYAIANDIIDEGSIEITKEMVSRADVVVFGLYPSIIIDWVNKYQSFFKPGCIITDVTGVKTCLVYDLQKILRDDVEFIAAHPMCGREVYGVENSTEKMFIGANYIVVPTEKNSQDAISFCKEIGATLGCGNITVLSPEKHDEMIGFVSQLTHVLAVTLMTCSDNTHLAEYTGDSFRDLTRIARINDAMWSELFDLNKDALLAQMDTFMDEFKLFREMLSKGDIEGMREKMRLSTQRRALFDKKPKQ